MQQSEGTPSGKRVAKSGLSSDRTSPALVSDNLSSHARDRVLTISGESQHISGIVTKRLAAFSHKSSIAAYGEVLDLKSLIQLRNSYTSAKAEARKSVLQLRISRNEYARAKTLFTSTKYVSLEKLQNAGAAYDSDLADSEAAFQNLSGLKGEMIQEWGSVIAHWIAHNSTAAEELIDHRLSIILVTIPPNSGIDKAPRTAEVEAAGGTMLEATFVSVSPVSDPAIQGLSYFYRVPANPSLSVGMNVVAHLAVGGNTVGVAIPASAVVWCNGSPWVFLRTGNEQFIRKEIATTKRTEDGWFVNDGVKPGEELVVDGAQLLLSQEFKGRAQTDNN